MVIGIGTRYSDFTTASRTAFGAPGVRFVNINVASFDAAKHGGIMVQADRARHSWHSPTRSPAGRWTRRYREEATQRAHEWDEVVGQAYALGTRPAPGPVRGHRRGQRSCWSARCRGVRRGLVARRSAQVVADARPQGLPCRVRLFVHGLRDRGRHGRQDGGSGPQRVHHGRRRLLPDARPGAGHRRPGADPADRRAHPEPRLPVDRSAVRNPLEPSVSGRATAIAPNQAASRGKHSRSIWPPTRQASALGRSASKKSTNCRWRWPKRRRKRIRGPWSSTWRPTRWCLLRMVAAGGMSRLPRRRTSIPSRRQWPTTSRANGASGRICKPSGCHRGTGRPFRAARDLVVSASG